MSKAKMRIGSILLVVAMLMTLLPVGVFAADETLEESLMDAEKFCEDFQKAMETEAGPTWLQVGNAGLSYKAAADAVAALGEGKEKTAAEARLEAVKAVYDEVTELDMSGKTDGFLETSGKPVDLHAALVYFSNLETLNLSNNNLTDVGWLVNQTINEEGQVTDTASAFKNLKNLDLSDNSGITEGAYGSLTYVSLETLNLSNTGITTIAPLTTHGGTPAIASSLVSLDVSGTAWSNFAELWKGNGPSMSALKNLTAKNLKNTITDIGALNQFVNMEGFNAESYTWDLTGTVLDNTSKTVIDQLAVVRDAFKNASDNFKMPTLNISEELSAAILKDQSADDKQNLAENYKVTAAEAEGYTQVTITADNLRKHKGKQGECYWVGFALKAPVGAEKVKYSFAANKDSASNESTIALEPNVTEAGDSGIAFYIDASAESPKLYAKVQWLDVRGNALGEATEYQVNIDGVTMLIEDSGIKAATLHDTTGAVADSYLYDQGSYDVTVTKKVSNDYYDVAITAKNLRKHNNADDPSSFAYWVGFAVPAADGASHFKYAWAEKIGDDATANAKEEIFVDEYGVAPYLKADQDNGTFFTVQWMSNESTAVGSPVTYKVDLSGVTLNTAATTITGVTVMENGEVSAAISAAVSGTQINLSGLANSKSAPTLKLVLNTNAGGKVEKDITLTYAEGTGFSISGDNKVTVAGTEYTIDVSAISVMPEDVKVEAGEADTKVSDTISSDDKDAVEDALGEIDVENATVVVAQAANAEITKVTSGLTEEKIEELLAEANEGKTGTPYDTIKVVAYLQVAATGYTQAGEGTELAFTLDIQPMYKVVAADADDSTTNPDKDTGISGKLNVSSTAEPVEITVGLPNTFASDASTPVYVYHKNYIYATTLDASGTSGGNPVTATFTNPHGFSEFTLKTTAGASVTDLNGKTTVYATLQDAVNAVKNGETIKLLADNQTATVAKTVTFKVDKDGKNCIIKDGYGKTVEPDANGVYTITFYGYPDDGGSTTTPTSYGITVSTAENGTVKSSNSSAAKDATVTITVTPNEGYVLDTLTVTDKDNNTVALTKVSDTQYTFKMPASVVTVKATFKKDEGTQPAALPFNDVSESEWFYEAVKYVYDKGMMNGVSDTSFAPYSNLTRGMIAQVLYNLEGKPAVSGSAYTDVAADQWYNDAVNWAAQKGIVTGYGDGTFGPMDNITREQMAAILYRYAQYKGYDVSAKGDLTAFTDGNTVSDWAKDAMSWAVGTALFNGKGDGILDPTTTATRAEVAKILMTYCENVAK